MQNNKERGVLYSAVVLLLISGLVACIVAFVNGITAPVIQKNTEESIRQSINLIFDGNAGYEDITAVCQSEGKLNGAEGVASVYRVTSGTGGEDSYCILSKAVGYGGDVELLVGFSCDGVISGVKVLSASGETPGIGQQITEEEFLARFGGLSSNAVGTAIDGISGATVSSTAAVKAVNGACIAINNLLGLNEEAAQ